MESTTPFPVYVAAAVVAVFATLVWRRRSRSSSSSLPLPGPAGLPLVGNLPFLDTELHSYFANLARTYGPIFRLRLGSKLGVVISSPSLARAVLREHDTTFADRDVPAAARVLAYGGNDIGWSPLGPTWRMLRRVCARGMLCPASLDAVYGLLRREVRATVSHLHAKAGRPVDVGAETFLTAMNVMTGMLWGGPMQEGVEREKLGSEFRQLVWEIAETVGLPNLSDFFPVLERFDLQGVRKRMKVLHQRLDTIFQVTIEKRKAMADGGESYKDFLQYMLKLEAEDGDAETPFTITHVKSLLTDMIVGGTEATSNTAEWAMAELLRKPELTRRVQEELDSVVGKDNVVESSHIPKLHFLGLVIKEVLRLHPALPLLIPHCPTAPCTVGGYTIPQASRVFVNVWSIHRDPSLWDEPSEFKPDRFLSTPGKWDYNGNNFSYLPFGSGRRICLAIGMAESLVTYTLASLLHSFDWKLQDGAEHDLTEKFGMVLKKAQPLVAIPTPRLANPELYS